MNILLTLSYDGTNYCGWQIQPNGDTIQARLEQALARTYGAKIAVTGASRTDAGVHAAAQRACFTVDGKVPLSRLPQVINRWLPDDITVIHAEEVHGGFHPIEDAKRKTYEYRILNASCPDPKRRNYTFHVIQPLDFEKMRAAAWPFAGTHDFAAFMASGSSAKTTVRTVYELNLQKKDDEILIYVTGGGFLYNMVRIITGTLIEAGMGKIEPDAIPQIILSKERKRAGRTAPARGLTLVSVEY